MLSRVMAGSSIQPFDIHAINKTDRRREQRANENGNGSTQESPEQDTKAAPIFLN
jgi:hypothetical protein